MLSLFRISWPIFFSFRFSFFFFWKEDKIDFLSNLSSLKLSHSDWHFPLVLPLTKTMTACHRLNAECQHFISEKAMLFLQELVFLMEPAYGPFNRKLKRLQNTIYQPFNQAVAIFFFFCPQQGIGGSRKRDGRWEGRGRWGLKEFVRGEHLGHFVPEDTARFCPSWAGTTLTPATWFFPLEMCPLLTFCLEAAGKDIFCSESELSFCRSCLVRVICGHPLVCNSVW